METIIISAPQGSGKTSLLKHLLLPYGDKAMQLSSYDLYNKETFINNIISESPLCVWVEEIPKLGDFIQLMDFIDIYQKQDVADVHFIIATQINVASTFVDATVIRLGDYSLPSNTSESLIHPKGFVRLNALLRIGYIGARKTSIKPVLISVNHIESVVPGKSSNTCVVATEFTEHYIDGSVSEVTELISEAQNAYA